MIRIRVLGCVSAERSDGAVGPASEQRKPLALLVLLAMAGPRGRTRDELVAFLWPNADADSGRKSLKQTVYALRRDLGADQLILSRDGDQRLALNPEIASTDAAEFERAIERNALELAVELYGGPFLDGFSIRASAEFDHWIDAERLRLSSLFAVVLERLAARAESTPDYARAGEWWRRLAAMKPLDSRIASRLIECLAADGDRTAALMHARVHQTLLREELDAAPDPAITALEHALRSGAGSTRHGVFPAVGQTRDTESSADERGGADTPAPDPRPRFPVARRRTIAAIAAVFGIVAATAAITVRGEGWPAEPSNSERLAVLPFRVVSADTSLAYLGEGLVDLIVAKIGGTRLRPVSAARSIASMRSSTHAPSASAEEVALSAATALHASHAVTGAVHVAGRNVTLQAQLFDVSRGRALSLPVVEGDLTGLTALLDRFAAEILGAALGGSEERTPTFADTPLDAVRAYAVGRQAFRMGEYQRAANSLQRAIDIDSTFALAALELSRVTGWLGDEATRHTAQNLAWAHRDRLSGADLALLTAIVGPAFPKTSNGRERVAAWERVTQLMPDEPDAWFELGDQLFHGSAMLGDSAELDRIAPALDAALRRDGDYGPALEHALQFAARVGDTGTVRALAERAITGQAATGQGDFLRWRVAVALPDHRNELAALRSRFESVDVRSLTSIALAAIFDQVEIADATAALRSIERRAARTDPQADALLGAHAVALARGHRREAAQALDRLSSTSRGRDATYLSILDAIYAGADTRRAGVMVGLLERSEVLHPSRLGAVERADSARAAALGADGACVLAQWWLSRNDPGRAADAFAALERWRLILDATGATSRAASVDANVCVLLLTAWTRVSARANDALASLAVLDSATTEAPPMTARFEAQLPVAVAVLWERMGRSREALRAIRRTGYFYRWPHYRAEELRIEARLAAGIGDTASALVAYERYLALRDSPDEATADDVAAARLEVRRLSAR
jgi:DNA-binding SARP family transcriptional activator/TolB-like protein